MSQFGDRRRGLVRRRLGDVPILHGFAISMAMAAIVVSGLAWLVA